METPIGEDTGDGSTLTAESCRAGYQFDGLPQGQVINLEPTVVLKNRRLAGLQRGVKHFVLQRYETSPEAHLSKFHNC